MLIEPQKIGEKTGTYWGNKPAPFEEYIPLVQLSQTIKCWKNVEILRSLDKINIVQLEAQA